jgi:SAM-dependent methyltransferase
MSGQNKAWEVGSLAHYADPALYRHRYARRRADIAYYQRLAGQAGAPVLEYGCGEGRITLGLAKAGIRVVGVDHSAPMLASLQAALDRSPALGAHVRLVEGDMRRVQLDDKFALVCCAFNTFLHLYTRADVESFLAHVRAHLAPGGLFAFDVLNPNPVDLARSPDRPLKGRDVVHPESGERLRTQERFDYDAASQVLHMVLEYSGPHTQFSQPLSHRQFYPQELQALLHYNGFVIESFEGGFAGEPFDDQADVMAVTARIRS